MEIIIIALWDWFMKQGSVVTIVALLLLLVSCPTCEGRGTQNCTGRSAMTRALDALEDRE